MKFEKAVTVTPRQVTQVEAGMLTPGTLASDGIRVRANTPIHTVALRNNEAMLRVREKGMFPGSFEYQWYSITLQVDGNLCADSSR